MAELPKEVALQKAMLEIAELVLKAKQLLVARRFEKAGACVDRAVEIVKENTQEWAASQGVSA